MTLDAKVLVTESVGAPFRVRSVQIEDPRPGEVRVRLAACGVCHTDLVAVAGDFPFTFPGVLGHEGTGTIDAVGAGVTSVREGDRVVIGWPWCGQCRNCRSGQPRFCRYLKSLVSAGTRADGSTALRLDGRPLHAHFFGQSSFATHSITSERAVVRVETSAPVTALGVLACGITTGAGAVLNVVRPRPGDSVVVYGAGAVGLAAVMAARCTAAVTIIAVDPVPSRRALAAKFGATEVIDPGSVSDVVAAVHEICRGPADSAFECTGIRSVVRQAIDSVGMLGTCCLIGSAQAGAEFSAGHRSTVWGKRIVGTLGGESTSDHFVPALLRLYEQGRFPFTDLIEYFPMERIDDAVAAARGGDVIKPVLSMT
jgi:Zn-dependent alcohol dehydrogenase